MEKSVLLGKPIRKGQPDLHFTVCNRDQLRPEGRHQTLGIEAGCDVFLDVTHRMEPLNDR